ncbi:MAG: hypothetical protein JRN21_00425 [Nitrososphaerota archaeon]|nr:hypothetical protein [Nitrososphaerota archaeon]
MTRLNNSRWLYFCEVCAVQPETIHATETGFFCAEHCPYMHDSKGECGLSFKDLDLKKKYEGTSR